MNYYDEIYDQIALLEVEIMILESEVQTDRVCQMLKEKRANLENLNLFTQLPL